MTIYSISRATPSGSTTVATGADYKALCQLAQTAAKAEQPNCAWIVAKGAGDLAVNMAVYEAKGTTKLGKMEIVK